MGSFLNVTVMWFIIGFVLFLLEFVVPGFILFFFGVGAWVVAVVTLFTDISVSLQLAIFLGTSLLTVLLIRNWVTKKLGMNDTRASGLEDEFIGKPATAETAIGPGMNGKVTFKGTSWDASSEDIIAPGEVVTIAAYRSILLIVKSNK